MTVAFLFTRPTAGQGPSVAPRSVQLAARADTTPITFSQGSRATVQVLVNGKGPFVFGIETGAPFILVTSRVAQLLGSTASASHAGPGSGFRVDSLRIGKSLLQDVQVVAGPQLLPGIDGLLGLPAFADLLLTVDYPNALLILSRGDLPPVNGRDILTAQSIGPFYGVEIDVAGKKLPAVIDTQSALFLSFPPSFADSMTTQAPLVTTGRASVGGTAAVETRAGRLKGNVTLGQFTLPEPTVQFFPVPPGYPQDALLGAPLLKQFRMTLDQRNRRVRFEGPQVVLPRAPSIRAIGLAVGTQPDGTVRATLVTDGSAASEAGLRVGDLIVEIIGRPAREFAGPGQLTQLVSRESIAMTISRDGVSRQVEIRPKVLVP